VHFAGDQTVVGEESQLASALDMKRSVARFARCHILKHRRGETERTERSSLLAAIEFIEKCVAPSMTEC